MILTDHLLRVSGGEFSLSVKTSDDSSPASGGKVDLTVYGELGKSEDITLTAPSPQDKLFEPGNIDSFTVSTLNCHQGFTQLNVDYIDECGKH